MLQSSNPATFRVSFIHVAYSVKFGSITLTHIMSRYVL